MSIAKIGLIMAALTLTIAGFFIFTNRVQVVMDGQLAASGEPWTLAFYPDRQTETGTCLRLSVPADSMEFDWCTTLQQPVEAQIARTPSIGTVIVGWVQEGSVQSSVAGEIQISDPIDNGSSRRLFIQFVPAETESATISVDGLETKVAG